jgi:hypothetical protein
MPALLRAAPDSICAWSWHRTHERLRPSPLWRCCEVPRSAAAPHQHGRVGGALQSQDTGAIGASSVARFPGFSAELRGRVLDCGRGAELVRIQIGNGEELPARAGWPPLPEQRVEVLVRPAAVGLTAPDDPVASPRGEIADSAFRDRGYDHAVRLADGALLTELLAASSHQRGEADGLQIDPEGSLIYTYTLGEPTPLQLDTARAGSESFTVSGGRRSGPRRERRETMRMTQQGRIEG